MQVLLVEPDYYTRYPPLGLLKLASYHRHRGDSVELVRGEISPTEKPDRVYVTSLFTYSWRPVHAAVRHYKRMYPDVEVWLGGIYASLLPEHAALSGADKIHKGLFYEAENYIPAWDLVPKWKASILFASRGCIRRCGFCSVPKLEGQPNALRYGIRDLIYPSHTRVILWDNNVLGNQNWPQLFDELLKVSPPLEVDFNQGLDARCMTNEAAEKISRMNMPIVRLAYDFQGIGPSVHRAIEMLAAHGVRKRRIVVYVLFNYVDDPQNFFDRVRELLSWGVAAYPMRYEPLTSLEKNSYVAPSWTAQQLEMVAEARRVIGFAGAFPPYKGLVEKLTGSETFETAFELRPVRKERNSGDLALIESLKEQGADHQQYLPRTPQPRWGGSLDWREVTA